MSGKHLTGKALSAEILEIVAMEGMVDTTRLSLESKLADLDIQSADFVLILMAIEEKYDVYLSVDKELSGVSTVAELLEVVTRKVMAQIEARDG